MPKRDSVNKNFDSQQRKLKAKLKELLIQIPEDRLLGIVERFYAKMSTDILVGFFFRGRDLKSIAKKQTVFMLQSASITPTLNALISNDKIKPPVRAHDALPPILKGHFDRRLHLLREQLGQEFAADPNLVQNAGEAINTWVEFENSFRAQVEKKE